MRGHANTSALLRKGFTLIEIMVSCAVLGLLVVLLATAFSHFAGLTSASGKRLETGNQTRGVYDRMGFDLDASIRQGGIEITCLKNAPLTGGTSSNNDTLAMLADARSTDADSRLAKIAYEIDQDSNAATQTAFPALFRSVEPFLWTDSAAQTLPSSNAERQPLGRGVFRMELSFLKTDGNIVATPPDADELAAIICSTASLDEKTFSLLSPDQRMSLTHQLADAADGVLPLSTWSANDFMGYPEPVRQNVRFQQRQFYLK